LRKTSEVIQMTMHQIQSELKAPKGQYNYFGKYNYRSCEDIVEAVKPLLAKYKYYLNMSDEVIGVGNRVYIKATCRVMEGDKVIAESSALAREAEIKKGMDDSQITGTASSYARKYALNGLFAIDDTKDADTDAHRHQQVAVQPPNESLKTISQDHWESLDSEQQEFLRGIAEQAKESYMQGDLTGTNKLIFNNNLQAEEITAMSYLFDSKMRNDIKKFRETLRKAA
jgi:acetyltransferase-like isoleucine patch superfamily enzyme